MNYVQTIKIIFIGLIFFCNPMHLFSQQSLTFDHNALTREYILYIPDNINSNAPLVFVLHGYVDDPFSVMYYTRMNNIAEANGFVVCYPKGTSDQNGNLFWNVGYDFHANQTVDDISFLTALAEELQAEHTLNTDATFLTGFSNGGDMSYMIACQAPGVFKAVAPVAGALMADIFDTCDTSDPIPMFITNGTQDPITTWTGDIDNNEGWGAYYDIRFGFDYFSQKNNCSEFSIETLPDLNPGDGSTVIAEKHSIGINNNEVWLYSVIGGGHDWPGYDGNMDIDLSTEIWGFFELYILNSTLASEDIDTNNETLLYPNPSNSHIFIESNKIVNTKYQLFSLQGGILESGVIDSEKYTIDVSLLSPNVYFLLIENTIHKIVKVK